jgi:hypothetical protein
MNGMDDMYDEHCCHSVEPHFYLIGYASKQIVASMLDLYMTVEQPIHPE